MEMISERIYEVVKKIPKGRVATYGQVAEMAGNRKMARAVGNALHKNPDPENIPCFRVVNRKGQCSPAFAFGGAVGQAERLEKEGVQVIDGRVDLEKYGIITGEGKTVRIYGSIVCLIKKWQHFVINISPKYISVYLGLIVFLKRLFYIMIAFVAHYDSFIIRLLVLGNQMINAAGLLNALHYCLT
jgi:O-6-methylguanine DNA methyltransferase